ncbi:hypothetical protein Tco_0358401, partial [Tanacetum coccineum]
SHPNATILLLLDFGGVTTCLSGISVSDYESSKHRKGETMGATDTGGGELSDGSASVDEWVSSSSTPASEATAVAPPPVQPGPQQK